MSALSSVSSRGDEEIPVDAMLGEDQLLGVDEAFPDKYGWHVPALVRTDVTQALFGADAHWRDKLCHFLHQRKVHITLTVLLVADILIVITAAILEIQILQEELSLCEDEVHELEEKIAGLEDSGATEEGSPAAAERIAQLVKATSRSSASQTVETLETVEKTLAWISISILIIFLVEHGLLLIAFGTRYFKNLFYILDLFLIVVSLVLELLFFNDPEGGLVILGRAWRFARIAHGLLETSEREYKKEFHEDVNKAKDELESAMEVVCDTYYTQGLDGRDGGEEDHHHVSFRKVSHAVRENPAAAKVAAQKIIDQQPTLVFELVASVGGLYAGMQKHRPQLNLLPKKYLKIATHFGQKHRKQ